MKICYVAGALKWELLLSGLMIDTKLGSIQSSHQRRFLAELFNRLKAFRELTNEIESRYLNEATLEANKQTKIYFLLLL